MKEVLWASVLPEIGKEAAAKSTAVVDFSVFERSAKLRRNNLAMEQAERVAELSALDFGECFPDSQSLKLAANETQKKDVPSGYQFENKQEYSRMAQEMLYAQLGIDPSTEKNDWEKKFLKGFIDGAVLSNADFVEEIIRDLGKIVDALKNIDVIAVLEWLGESFGKIFSWDWYIAGQGFGETGFVVTGAWLAVAWGKKLVKKGLESAWKAVRNATEIPSPVSGSLRAQRWTIGDLSEMERRLPFDITKNEVYRRHSFLRDHAEFLGDLKPADIMGAGNNAIVVRHPKIEGWVVKIPYPGEVDSVAKEIRSHEKAFLALKKGISDGKVSGKVRIPEVYADIPDMKNIFVMQRVEGQSLHTKMLLELPEYKGTVETLSKTRDVSRMTDNEVYRHLANNHPFWAEYLDMVIKGPKSAEYTKAYIDSHPEAKNALDHLDTEKIGHADIHGGNIMLGRDGNTYLIDFGRVSSHSAPPITPSSAK